MRGRKRAQRLPLCRSYTSEGCSSCHPPTGSSEDCAKRSSGSRPRRVVPWRVHVATGTTSAGRIHTPRKLRRPAKLAGACQQPEISLHAQFFVGGVEPRAWAETLRDEARRLRMPYGRGRYSDAGKPDSAWRTGSQRRSNGACRAEAAALYLASPRADWCRGGARRKRRGQRYRTICSTRVDPVRFP